MKSYREQNLISKAELARKAGVSVLAIDHIENGKICRLETKEKIILALDLKLSEKNKIFGNIKYGKILNKIRGGSLGQTRIHYQI